MASEYFLPQCSWYPGHGSQDNPKPTCDLDQSQPATFWTAGLPATLLNDRWYRSSPLMPAVLTKHLLHAVNAAMFWNSMTTRKCFHFQNPALPLVLAASLSQEMCSVAPQEGRVPTLPFFNSVLLMLAWQLRTVTSALYPMCCAFTPSCPSPLVPFTDTEGDAHNKCKMHSKDTSARFTILALSFTLALPAQ